MTGPDAAAAAQALLAAAETGGRGAALVVVGPADSPVIGRRLVLVAAQAGSELRAEGSLGSDAYDAEGRALAEEALADPRGRDGLRTLAPAGADSLEVYVELRRPVQELVIVGAGHIARPLARLGALLGYRVAVLDDRPDFATRERFPEAERVVRADFSDPFVDVPLHERSHVILVTRGHKYDYACLVRALRMDPPPAYIGMIGSRRRVRATYVQLLDEGLGHDALDLIHAPVGLDIGAETPEEIAVAVAAELVLVRRGGSGTPLKSVERIAERFFERDDA